MKYTTLTKVQALAPDTTLTNTQIESVIEFVSGYIDTYVGYVLAQDYSAPTQDILVDGSGTPYLILNQPVNGSLTLENTQGGVSVVPSDYIVSYPLNKPYTDYLGIRSGVFQSGMANYTLKSVRIGRYTIDFTPNSSNHTLPNEITEIVTELVARQAKNNSPELAMNPVEANTTASSGIITQETTGSYSVSYANPSEETLKSMLSALPNGTTILNKYKKVSIA